MPADPPELELVPMAGGGRHGEGDDLFSRVIRRGNRLRRERQAVLAMGLAALSLLAVAMPLALADDSGERLQTTASAPPTLPGRPTPTQEAQDQVAGAERAIAGALGRDLIPGTLTTVPKGAPVRTYRGGLAAAPGAAKPGGTSPSTVPGEGPPTTTPSGGDGPPGTTATTAPPGGTTEPPVCRGTPTQVRQHDRVIFVRDAGDLWAANVARGGVEPVLQTPEPETGPALSPDGTQIAFARNGDIFTMPAGGGEPVQRAVGSLDGGGPAWSQDGKRIAFVRDGDPWVLYVDDSKPVSRIVDMPRSVAGPTWSPDGCYIAVTMDGDLWRIRSDGSDAGKLRDDASQASWSSDGRIAFVRSAGDIWTVGADGTAAPLTDGANPSWSGDRSQIAFERDGEIFTVPSGGGAPTNRTNDPAADSEPAW